MNKEYMHFTKDKTAITDEYGNVKIVDNFNENEPLLENKIELLDKEIRDNSIIVKNLRKDIKGFNKLLLIILILSLGIFPLNLGGFINTIGTILLSGVYAIEFILVLVNAFKYDKKVKNLDSYLKEIKLEKEKTLRELELEKTKRITKENENIYKVNDLKEKSIEIFEIRKEELMHENHLIEDETSKLTKKFKVASCRF